MSVYEFNSGDISTLSTINNFADSIITYCEQLRKRIFFLKICAFDIDCPETPDYARAHGWEVIEIKTATDTYAIQLFTTLVNNGIGYGDSLPSWWVDLGGNVVWVELYGVDVFVGPIANGTLIFNTGGVDPENYYTVTDSGFTMASPRQSVYKSNLLEATLIPLAVNFTHSHVLKGNSKLIAPVIYNNYVEDTVPTNISNAPGIYKPPFISGTGSVFVEHFMFSSYKKRLLSVGTKAYISNLYLVYNSCCPAYGDDLRNYISSDLIYPCRQLAFLDHIYPKIDNVYSATIPEYGTVVKGSELSLCD